MLVDVLKKRGAILDVTNMQHGPLRDLLLGARTRLRGYAAWQNPPHYTRSSRKICIEFINSDDAFAFSYASTPEDGGLYDFIGISVALVLSSLDIFTRGLAHPSNMTFIGDPSLEISDRFLPYLTSNTLSFGEKLQMPRCPVRSAAATWLHTTVIDHLFFHELNHLKNGHLELANAMNRGNLKIDGKACTKNLIAQTLEWDADHCAFYDDFNAIATKRNHIAHEHRLLAAHEMRAFLTLFGTDMAMISTLFLAIHIILRMEDHRNWVLSAQMTKSHPQPPFRLMMVYDSIKTILEDSPKINATSGRFEEVRGGLVHEAEKFCANLVGNDIDLGWAEAVLANDDFPKYQHSLHSCWGAIRPVLMQSMRGDSIPN